MEKAAIYHRPESEMAYLAAKTSFGFGFERNMPMCIRLKSFTEDWIALNNKNWQLTVKIWKSSGRTWKQCNVTLKDGFV